MDCIPGPRAADVRRSGIRRTGATRRLDRPTACGIGVGDLDLFYRESVDYAERLTTRGVPCTLLTVPGMYHGADGVAAKAKSMKEFRASMIEHLRAHL
jgi:acetyl esterase/lipase